MQLELVNQRTLSDPKASLEDLLHEGTVALGLELHQACRDKLLAYLNLMIKWNAVFNLTAIRDPRQMLIQHLLDSLSVIPVLRRHLDLDHAELADVGSGAGLPGLPIAMVCPSVRLVSVEPVGKKAAFQRQVAAELALTNVEVYAGRVESLDRPVDLVTCRAFASLADFLKGSFGLIRKGTVLAALKGQGIEVDAECAALPPACQIEIEPLDVPFLLAQRHLVLIRNAPGRHHGPEASPA